MAGGGWAVAEAADEAEVESSLQEALGWLRQADALLVVGRGPAECGESLGAGLEAAEGEEAINPSLFMEDPRDAWGRWRRAAQRAKAAFRRRPQAAGGGVLRRWSQQLPLGALACTSDDGGRWQQAGWPAHQVVELRGNARRLQCAEPCCAELWDAEEELGLEVTQGRAVGLLPSCQRCSEVARPWVRLARWDEAFLEESSWAETLATMAHWTERMPDATVVQLELGEDAVDEGYREVLENATESLRCCRFVRVILGADPEAEPSAPSRPGDKIVRVPLEQSLALDRLQRLYAEVPIATFIMTDPEGGGAEFVLPMHSTGCRIFARSTLEFNKPIEFRHGEHFFMVANHLYSGAGRREEHLDWHQIINNELFMNLRQGDSDDQEVGVSVRIHGVRYHEHNGRLHERILGVRSLLMDLLSQFRTQEYQDRLRAARDQLEVKALIKEAHVAVLPKYGFHLTMETDVGKTIKAQICMQTYIDSVSFLDVWLGQLSGETLPMSGMQKMPTLPMRTKGKEKVRPSRISRTSHFKHHDPSHPVLYGCWLGDRRASVAFVEAPCFDLLSFLREDPEGPFFGEVDSWPVDGLDDASSRWSQWGFEKDKRELFLKSDWHTFSQEKAEKELFIPRLGKAGVMQRAPPRFLAFAKAFRDVNRSLFKHLASALKELAVQRMSLEHVDTDGSLLMSELAQCLETHGHLGVIEAQVWWGDEPLVLPSHKDGATSLLHMGLTLGGCRTLRVGTYATPDDGLEERAKEEPSVWDTTAWIRNGQLATGLKDVRMVRGCAYLSSPYAFEHGVRYERGTRMDPIIALQCRVAFSPELGRMLNDMRDDLMLAVSGSVAALLKRTAESGELRMPSLQEVMARCPPSK